MEGGRRGYEEPGRDRTPHTKSQGSAAAAAADAAGRIKWGGGGVARRGGKSGEGFATSPLTKCQFARISSLWRFCY